MILSPLENSGVLLGGQWLQRRPYVTQEFGKNPEIYKQFGMHGHNGADYRAREGTPIFASHDGTIKVVDSGKAGYGLHIKIRDEQRLRETVYAHLSNVSVIDGEEVHTGSFLGYTGNTGFSTAAHLHFGFRQLIKGKGDVFSWKVKNYDNGFFGWIDIDPITYKGTLTQSSIFNL